MTRTRIVKRIKNYPLLCTTISRQPEVVSGRIKKSLEGKAPTLPTIVRRLKVIIFEVIAIRIFSNFNRV